MVNDVFVFLCDAFVILLLAEIAVLVFVSIHETFRDKRDRLRRYYRERRRRNKE